VRLLVTRPQPEGGRTAVLLRQRGHEVLWLPLLRIEPVANAEFGAGPWAAVLFTSANAVRAVAAHRRFGELADLAAYTVGRRTQAAAAAAGFVSVMSADGDVNALARLVASRLESPAVAGASLRRGSSTSSAPACGEGSGVGAEPRGAIAPPTPPPHPGGESKLATQSQRRSPEGGTAPLLYCAGEARAGDLAAALQPHGLRVEVVIVYRTTVVTELTADVRAALASGAIDAVLHYSTRTAAAFVDAATRAGIDGLSIQARHFCLSTQVAAPLAAAGVTAIDVASEPNEPALLALLSRT
jgi:uroporphyrinogen-III synthase